MKKLLFFLFTLVVLASGCGKKNTFTLEGSIKGLPSDTILVFYQEPDYKLDTIKDMASGEVKPTGLPSSNVLYYDLNDGAWICVRPSGTEPKIKFYYGIKGSSMEDADAKSEALGAAVMAMVDKMM